MMLSRVPMTLEIVQVLFLITPARCQARHPYHAKARKSGAKSEKFFGCASISMPDKVGAEFRDAQRSGIAANLLLR